MRISVKESKKGFSILLPNCIIFSRLSLSVAKRQASKRAGVDLSGLTPRVMRELRRTAGRMRKIHRNLYLVEVEDGDSTVKVKL